MIVVLYKITKDHYTPCSFHDYSMVGTKFFVSCYSALNYCSQLSPSIFSWTVD